MRRRSGSGGANVDGWGTLSRSGRGGAQCAVGGANVDGRGTMSRRGGIQWTGVVMGGHKKHTPKWAGHNVDGRGTMSESM